MSYLLTNRVKEKRILEKANNKLQNMTKLFSLDQLPDWLEISEK